MASDHHSESEYSPADGSGDAQRRASSPDEEGIDRRRLIRWIAVLAFAVPVVVELFTFGNLLENELLPGDEQDGGPGATATPSAAEETVGVGDELLPETAASETVVTSEVRGDPSSEQTYVLRVAIENDTESSVELRLTRLRLRDGAVRESVASSGTVAAGEEGELTGAWTIPGGSMPGAVETVALRNGEQVVSRFVDLKRPAIRG